MKAQTMRFLLLIMLILSLWAPSTIVHAAAFTVTNLADSGTGSLRQAILDANATAAADTITFSISGTILLGSTLPAVTAEGGALTIDGTGRTVTISGGNAVRVLVVNSGASLTLSNLTIANGSVTSDNGGGILNSGALSIANSTFSGNSASSGGFGGFGGGIYNDAGTLTATNSTFSGNSASGAFGGGGGIYLNGGTAAISNNTFSGNSATGAGSSGGGILNPAGTMTLGNTIVANSTGGNCGGTITNGGDNLDDDGTCGWASASGSRSYIDPSLGALADNGGSTQTFALLPGSPAIDGVTFSAPNGAPSTDQRGVARPKGLGYDIGAFESEAQPGPAFIVNASADTNDGFCDLPGQGADNKDCTLREAVNAANIFPGANTITFSASGTITLSSTLPSITDPAGLTIDGTGRTVTVSGNTTVRVAIVDASASLTLSNLSIANGNSGGDGGGIHNSGTLTITNSSFSGNSATTGDASGGGGGIHNAGTLSVTNSAFSGNSVTGFGSGGGGAIHNTGTLTVTSSTFSGNTVSVNGGGVYNVGTVTISNTIFSGNSAGGGGGAIVTAGGFSALTVTKSTFSGNSASTGGGIYSVADTAITNSTFSGNSAGAYGGGIISHSGKLSITNSTFSGNSASSGVGGIYQDTAGIVTVRNTIVANNPGGNCSGAIADGGNNIDSGITCGWGTASGSMSGTNPLLGALANNGGATPTFALLPGSPAIGGVTFNAPNGAPFTDQRGVPRPQGLRYDIGALESETNPDLTLIVNTSADTNDGFCDILGQGAGNKDCTLREAVNAANAFPGANTINFSVSGPITLSTQLPNITAAGGALTMDGTAHAVTISGNHAVRVLGVGTGASLTLNGLTIANGGSNGIYNGGTLTITNSTLSGNSAAWGGGIYNTGALTITNSTLSGNSATSGGGGIDNSSGTLTIANSTFSSNSATGGGGGVLSNAGTLTITNSTFSGNSASAGSGIYNFGGPATLRNTIVANSASGVNCLGTITNGGNNIDSGTSCGWGSANGSMSSANPLLGALGNNGGATQTFALLPGSPAIDRVFFNTPNGAPSTDQRGVARPQGLRYDIGAYEAAAQSNLTFTVNASADTDDGFCDSLGQGTGNKDCTLREAINSANALAGANTIIFSISGPISLAGSQLPNITAAGGALTIGAGQTVTISGNNAVRVLQVDAGASLTLNGLTIANGNSGSNGGGIYNGGTLTIANSAFSGNRATSGGGIYNFGTVAITNSVFSGNSADWGAGIYNASARTLTITNSSFSGNSVTGIAAGSGIYNVGTLNITNSTFSGNSADYGSSVYNWFGTAVITNSTFSGNSAAVMVGGIQNNSGTVTLRNTIVANNAGGNCAGGITNGGNNIDSGTTCNWGSANGSKSSTNPLLGALTGGPAYFPLVAGSPAIDAGSDAFCPATDQRGVARPIDGNHDGSAVCDIGAYEAPPLWGVFLPLARRN